MFTSDNLAMPIVDTRHRIISTKLRLYVRQSGEWFCYIKQTQSINCQMIAMNITHRNSCQVVCFFIGPGGYSLPQRADIQHYQSFITRQVIWKFRNVESEHINIVKRRKTLRQRKRKGGHTQGFPPALPFESTSVSISLKRKKHSPVGECFLK